MGSIKNFWWKFLYPNDLPTHLTLGTLDLRMLTFIYRLIEQLSILMIIIIDKRKTLFVNALHGTFTRKILFHPHKYNLDVIANICNLYAQLPAIASFSFGPLLRGVREVYMINSNFTAERDRRWQKLYLWTMFWSLYDWFCSFLTLVDLWISHLFKFPVLWKMNSCISSVFYQTLTQSLHFTLSWAILLLNLE